MQQVKEFLETLHNYIGGSQWFVFLLLGTGLFFTIYLKFPQVRYFWHAIKVVKGKFEKKEDVGDASHFQALTTALSGTIGTGNIAGVALAVHLGGPAGLFWMLITAILGMTTKLVEITISHKYRDILPDGSISGGPMYYMKKRLNIKLKNGTIIKTGTMLGVFFAIGTILSSFGTGSLPQINSISNSIFTTFGLKHIITGAILAVLLGLVIVGGIKRIAKVTSKLVPGMAIIYFLGAILVIATNYQNIIPSFISIFQGAFSGAAITGGFLGASFAFVFNQGVNRGLFSNEAGQGSASIAHAAARTQEPVAEGMVALLGPFIDTIIICMLTGLVLLSSGVWKEKLQNRFQNADMQVLAQVYDDGKDADKKKLSLHLGKKETLPLFTGQLNIVNGEMISDVTFIHARSIAEDMVFYKDDEKYSGSIPVVKGVVKTDESGVIIEGKSLMHSAPLTTEAYKRSILGDFGKYIVSIGLLLFAFSTAIAWSYYGDRAVTFLVGTKYVIYYRLVYVLAFFLASFVDTTIVWALSYITIVLMTAPNLLGLWMLNRDIKSSVKQYWVNFKKDHPEEKAPNGAL